MVTRDTTYALRFVGTSSVPRSAAVLLAMLITLWTGVLSAPPSATMDTLLVAAQPARRHLPKHPRTFNLLALSPPTKAGRLGATYNADKARVGQLAIATGRHFSNVNQFYP